jgi:hypothetical protein
MDASAQRRLHDLRIDEWSDLGLSVLALVGALAASAVHPPFAFPLFIGGVAALALGGRALFQRVTLVDELLLDEGAYTIGEIRRRGEELASMKSRRVLAGCVRGRLVPVSGFPLDPRVVAFREELRALADELDDEGLSLEPVCAARCRQFVGDDASSPLLNRALPADEIGSWIRRIRMGFDPAGEATPDEEHP